MKYKNKEEYQKIKSVIMLKIGVSNDNQLANTLGYTSNSAIAEWNKKLTIPDRILRKYYDNNEYKEPVENKSIVNNSSYTFDVLNVKASAGEGIENYEVEVIDSMSLDKMFFKTPPNTKKTKIIEVIGDSMIPTLLPGDHVLVDESKLYGIDGIYAIQMQGQIFIKRLQFNLDGTIDIISDNPKYSTRMFNPNDNQTPLSIIGMKTLSVQR